jgi:hypothetical protein
VQSNDLFLTKQEYKDAIDRALANRQEALKEIATLTLEDYDTDALLKLADQAMFSYFDIRRLKEEMRSKFPPSCNCNCHDTP